MPEQCPCPPGAQFTSFSIRAGTVGRGQGPELAGCPREPCGGFPRRPCPQAGQEGRGSRN